jgi:hypothetical protein
VSEEEDGLLGGDCSDGAHGGVDVEQLLVDFAGEPVVRCRFPGSDGSRIGQNGEKTRMRMR